MLIATSARRRMFSAGMPNQESVTDEQSAVAERLVLLERAVGATGRGIAADLGVSPQAWSDWKTGKRRFPTEKARILKRKYGASLDWIYLGDEAGNILDFRRKLEAAGTKRSRA
jgi:transcriptional regulator with XRE-family HTH domain